MSKTFLLYQIQVVVETFRGKMGEICSISILNICCCHKLIVQDSMTSENSLWVVFV